MTRIVLFAALLATAARNHKGLERPASEADLLRAFGFATCLAKAYEKTPFGGDAERVAGGYLEMGKLGIEPYAEVRKFAEALDAGKPSAVGSHNLAIMACLEFYESAKLKQLVRRAASLPQGSDPAPAVRSASYTMPQRATPHSAATPRDPTPRLVVKPPDPRVGVLGPA